MRLRLYFLSLLLLSPLYSQNREAVELIDRSRALPPEFAADSLLRIAADTRLAPTRQQRIDLVEEAFRLAAHAQMSTPVRGRDYHTDTRPGWRGFASDTGLNSLDLQVRAIAAMLALNPQRLRSMFSEMRPLSVETGSCKDLMRPNLEKYYKTLQLVADNGFTPKQRTDGEHERWVAEHVAAMVTPSQLSGAMRGLPKPTATIWNAYAAALPNVRHDWLDFTYADRDLPISPQTIVPLRDFLVRSFLGPRCSRRYWIRTAVPVPVPIERFNRFVKSDQPTLQIEPIDPSKIEPERTEEGYVLEEFWQSPKSKEVLLAMKWLNHGNRNLPGDKRFWTLEERQTTEWNERYLALLKLMEGWTADDEPSPADYFHMKAHTYVSLSELTPPGMQRTNAFRNLITWLNSSYNSSVPHAEWFTHAHRILSAKNVEPWLLDELEQHGNLVLSHYARMQKRAPGR